MLMIYQQAQKVIAWLGPAHEDLECTLCAVASVGSTLLLRTSSDIPDVFDVWRIVRGLSYLYDLPWFRRIWIQQEMYAARKLQFRFGAFELGWSSLLSNPAYWSRLPQLRSCGEMLANLELEWQSGSEPEPLGQLSQQIAAQLKEITALQISQSRNLKCFERFSQHGSDQHDLIETLLDTAALNATDVRDHIYGVFGITGFPAQAMTMQEWESTRQDEVLIPIDYSADVTAIYAAVTWATLMEGGLSVLAKFKAFVDFDDGVWDEPLPSWVIDWSLASRLSPHCSPRFSSMPKHVTRRLGYRDTRDRKVTDSHEGGGWDEADPTEYLI